MTSTTLPSPRERMVQAALSLLETGGVEAVSTRAVSAAAEVQPPTIYRQFGDMRGLLGEVAREGFSAYLQAKGTQPRRRDPVDELRDGWRLHVEFGLTHPHLYTLMYGAASTGPLEPAAQQGVAMLRALLQRVAEAGRLAVGVDRAAAMIHGAALGMTLSLLRAREPDTELSELMLDAVLGAILTPEARAGGSGEPTPASAPGPQAAAHAVSLVALLPGTTAPFSEAERTLLAEWLRRLM